MTELSHLRERGLDILDHEGRVRGADGAVVRVDPGVVGTPVLGELEEDLAVHPDEGQQDLYARVSRGGLDGRPALAQRSDRLSACDRAIERRRRVGVAHRDSDVMQSRHLVSKQTLVQ
ncbi:hypothetical protein KAE78_08025 [Microbacterium sp. NIBRBAC000506063]|nr:hypothetical protein [Microbacterium sp. NIBRBAC000506063]QTV79080.1 hypothetical protein KAE78_08025 [Microbacterium sp. NIBRBAC000506063]